MRIIVRICGILLIIAAIIVFFWQDIKEHFTDQVNTRVFETYQDGGDYVEVNRLESLITGITSEDEDADDTNAEAPGINISDDMAGIINIDSADISEPVYYGPVTEEKMRNGVAFVNGEDHLDMQNIPIAGHRVEGAGIRFNYLDRASIGDSITLVTREETREYRITDIFDVEPTEIGVMDQNEGNPQELTLITCDDYNPETLLFEKRMIVKAEILD
jgi:sortase A